MKIREKSVQWISAQLAGELGRISVIVLITATGTAMADVYMWVDETGQVHYSDQWVPGCEKVEIAESPTVAPSSEPPGPPVTETMPLPDPPVSATDEEPIYQGLRVISPREDECLRRTGEIVKVVVEVDPAPDERKLLQHPSHRLRVTLDGKQLESEFLIAPRNSSLVLFLTEVFRGSHRIQVAIEDAAGESLVRSQTVNFHVQQFSPIIRSQQLREQARPVPSPTVPTTP